MRANATNARLAAFSISSMHMKMMMALRRTRTPTPPMANRMTDSVTYAEGLIYLPPSRALRLAGPEARRQAAREACPRRRDTAPALAGLRGRAGGAPKTRRPGACGAMDEQPDVDTRGLTRAPLPCSRPRRAARFRRHPAARRPAPGRPGLPGRPAPARAARPGEPGCCR